MGDFNDMAKLPDPEGERLIAQGLPKS